MNALDRLYRERREASDDMVKYGPHIFDAPWRVVQACATYEVLEGTPYPNPSADNEKYLDALGRREAADAQIQALLAEFPRP